MILTVTKAWTEIQKAIQVWNLHKVIVVGCGSCSAQCQTGGTAGVKKLVAALEHEGIEIVATMVVEEPCDNRTIKSEFKLIQSQIDRADGIIVASCGSGAQTIAEFTTKPVVVTTNTIMIAQTEQIGIYHEKCRACGECMLNETGGICPITACAKYMLNGPCGGVRDGKCEVGNYTRPCGWIAIYDRLKSINRLDLFTKIRDPRDFTTEYSRQNSDIRKEMKEYYACETK
jgi:ferredoxin